MLSRSAKGYIQMLLKGFKTKQALQNSSVYRKNEQPSSPWAGTRGAHVLAGLHPHTALQTQGHTFLHKCHMMK